MAFDIQRVLERIEDKIETVDKKLDEHLLKHAQDDSRNYWPKKVLGRTGYVLLTIGIAFVTSHFG